MERPPADHDAALDDIDDLIVGRVHDLYDELDPTPPDLADRILFTMSLDDIDVAVCRLVTEMSAIAARDGDDTSRTVTFENADLTIMLRIAERGDGTVRVDGWIAPADECGVELRSGAAVLTARSDGHGRFAFDAAPRGLAHLRVRPLVGRVVVTQPVQL